MAPSILWLLQDFLIFSSVYLILGEGECDIDALFTAEPFAHTYARILTSWEVPC